MANSMVWVPEGGMLQITNRILQAEAPGVSASEIIYKITQERPQFGKSFFLCHGFIIALSSMGFAIAWCQGWVSNELDFLIPHASPFETE